MSDNMSQIGNINATQHSAFLSSIETTQKNRAALDALQQDNQQDISLEKLADAQERSVVGIQIKSQKLERKAEVKTEKAKRVQESILVRKEEADGLADQFSRRQGNREYHLDPAQLSQLAVGLGTEITEESDPDAIIALIRSRMMTGGKAADVAIVDKAFEFLLEVTRTQLDKAKGVEFEHLETIYKNIETAKAKHFEAYAIDIQVAQKIIGAVDAVVETTGMGVKETLDRYREVVHNPPDLQILRKHYETLGYKAMKLELKGLSTYLGANFKRTNLDNPELMQLAVAARKMQALLGVFRQSRGHMPTMESYLELNGVLAA